MCHYVSPDSNGYKEGHMLVAYDLDQEGRPFLRDNWETLLRAKESKLPETADDTSQTSKYDHVAAVVQKYFPHGYDEISVSGSGLLAALYAIRHTLNKTSWLTHLTCPTYQQMKAIAVDEKVADLRARTGKIEDTVNNFNLEACTQVCAEHFAKVQNGARRVQLLAEMVIGTPEKTYQMFPIDVFGEPDDYILVRHNGGEQWSGTQPRTPTEKSLEPQVTTPYDSDEPSDEDPRVTRRLKKANKDNDIDAFIEQGSARSSLATANNTNKRTAMLAFLAHHRTIDDYDAGDGPEPISYAQAMRMSDAKGWQGAVDRECESLKENEVFQLIDILQVPKGKRLITGKLIFKRKLWYDVLLEIFKRKFKARLVARGFQQEEGIDYEETFATVVKSSSYRTLIAIAAALGMMIYLMDVVTAFLHGDLEEEIYMKPPAGFPCPKGKVLRVCKALYGLKQSPRAWYQKLYNTMVQKLGFRVSKYDPCVFINDKLNLIVAIWVDDLMILAKDPASASEFRGAMAREFNMKDEGECTFYLGMNMEQTSDGIKIHQTKYLQTALERFGYQNLPGEDAPLPYKTILQKSTTQCTPAQKARYSSEVGCLNWLANQTRFDIAQPVSLLSRFTSNPSQKHIDAARHVWGYLKNTMNHGIMYQRNGSLVPTGYVDADYAMCPDTRRSTTGWVWMLAGAPVSWCSQRQKCQSLSTTDAEYIAGAEGAREGIWLLRFINDLRVVPHIPSLQMFTDNNAALKIAKNPELHQRTKHIDVRYHFLRERVMEVRDIKIQRVDTENNVADMFTKALSPARHEKLRKMMMQYGLHSNE